MDSPFGPDVQEPMLPRLYSDSARCRCGAREAKVHGTTTNSSRHFGIKKDVEGNGTCQHTRRVGRGAARSRRLHLPPLQASLPTYSAPTVTTCVVCGVATHWDMCLAFSKNQARKRRCSDMWQKRRPCAPYKFQMCFWTKGDVPAMPCHGCQPGFIRRCLVQRVCLSLYSCAASHDFSFQFHEFRRAAYSCLLW